MTGPAPLTRCTQAIPCGECGIHIMPGDLMALTTCWVHPTCLPEEDR